jgi:hypothetical protein
LNQRVGMVGCWFDFHHSSSVLDGRFVFEDSEIIGVIGSSGILKRPYTYMYGGNQSRRIRLHHSNVFVHRRKADPFRP